MSERNRAIVMGLLLAVQGSLLALIGFADMDNLIGFGAGFGAVMVLLGLVEAGRRMFGGRAVQ